LHASSQAPNAPQSEKTQSTGQGVFSLHASEAVSSGQASPLCSGWVSTERLRLRVPLPQVVVQAEYVDHSLTAQSIGHGPVLQGTESAIDMSHTAPFWAATMMVRRRVLSPPAQSTVHAPHPPHSELSHGTGHAKVLHVAVSKSDGQNAPLNCIGVVIVRVLDLRPAVPQV
jgi:hypothetical protein